MDYTQNNTVDSVDGTIERLGPVFDKFLNFLKSMDRLRWDKRIYQHDLAFRHPYSFAYAPIFQNFLLVLDGTEHDLLDPYSFFCYVNGERKLFNGPISFRFDPNLKKEELIACLKGNPETLKEVSDIAEKCDLVPTQSSQSQY